MTKEIIIIIGAMFASPFIGIWIKGLFDKNKTSAETNNIQITGEVSIADAWQKYAHNIQSDFEKLRHEFAQLSAKFEEIRYEKEALATLTKQKDTKIKELEERIVLLEAEIEKYKKESSPQYLATKAHIAIENIKNKAISEE